MTQLKQKAAERTERSDNIETKQKLGVKQQLLHYFFTVKKNFLQSVVLLVLKSSAPT